VSKNKNLKMGNSITCFLIALLLFSIPENLLAQNDTAKVVTKAKIFDGEIGVIKSKNQLIHRKYENTGIHPKKHF